LTDRNNAIWDINSLFDAVFDEKAYKAASEPYTVPIDKIRKILGITESKSSLLITKLGISCLKMLAAE
jgi:hypothetical protein